VYGEAGIGVGRTHVQDDVVSHLSTVLDLARDRRRLIYELEGHGELHQPFASHVVLAEQRQELHVRVRHRARHGLPAAKRVVDLVESDV
jgi:hypothetical protein